MVDYIEIIDKQLDINGWYEFDPLDIVGGEKVVSDLKKYYSLRDYIVLDYDKPAPYPSRTTKRIVKIGKM